LAAPANPRRIRANGTGVTPVTDGVPLAILINMQRLGVDRIHHEQARSRKVSSRFHVGAGEPLVVEDSPRRLIPIESDQLVATQFDRRLTILLRELATDTACRRRGSDDRDYR